MRWTAHTPRRGAVPAVRTRQPSTLIEAHQSPFREVAMAVTTETRTQAAAPAQSAARTSTRVRLYTPGPVEIPARILRALSAVPPHHRTEVFRAIFRRVTDALRD